ncbi:37S ribosomal protein S9, mitochondrial [Malassezia sp. CBS 17886]|nr:37S ribosomal protein S9, mitochondrial [Malassezia sp. CBS 17886]
MVATRLRGALHASVPRAPAYMRGVHASRAVAAVAGPPGPGPPAPARQKPASPTFYTTKPSYVDTLLMLDELAREVKRALEQSHVLPQNSKPPPLPSGPTNIWISRALLHNRLGITLRASQYRSVISRLTHLLRYRSLVQEHLANDDAGGPVPRSSPLQKELAQQVEEVLASFMSAHGKAHDRAASEDDNAQRSTRGYIDDAGRAYARGRRKESSARVWLVRAKDDAVGRILVNNAPLAHHFTRTEHRERATWPFKLASMLGAYNVFAIVRGGGASGQAGALAHGTANALVAALGAAPGDDAAAVQAQVKQVLSKGVSAHPIWLTADGVLTRDPRMVERKKPGLAKARKAYTWVKR